MILSWPPNLGVECWKPIGFKWAKNGYTIKSLSQAEIQQYGIPTIEKIVHLFLHLNINMNCRTLSEGDQWHSAWPQTKSSNIYQCSVKVVWPLTLKIFTALLTLLQNVVSVILWPFGLLLLKLLSETIFAEEDFVIWGLRFNKQIRLRVNTISSVFSLKIIFQCYRLGQHMWTVVNFRMVDRHKQHRFETVCQWIHFPYILGSESNPDLTLC